MPTEGFPSGGEGGENPLATSARRRRERFDSFEDAYANFSSKPPLSSLDPEALHAYVDHGFALQPDGTVALKCRPEIEAQTYEMAVHHDAFRHLGEVQCPVTIATGGAGDFGPAAFGPAGRRRPASRAAGLVRRPRPLRPPRGSSVASRPASWRRSSTVG